MPASGPLSRCVLRRPQSHPYVCIWVLPASLHHLVLATQKLDGITGRGTSRGARYARQRMAAGDRWIDLLDPTLEELTARVPTTVHSSALEQLLKPAQHADEPRPKLESHGNYVFGVFLVAVALKEEDEVYYQEVDLVMTREAVVTVRKTPDGGKEPYDPEPAKAGCRARGCRQPDRVRGRGGVHARGRAQLRRRVRQAPPRGRGLGAFQGPRRRRPRLPPGEGRERPERRDEEADRDRLDPPAADADRRAVRPELR